MRASKARRMRRLIEALAEYLKDEEAVQMPELFRRWDGAEHYQKDQRVRYGDILYRCLQEHQAEPGWNPADAPGLWARVLIEDPNTTPEWVQPNSVNGYAMGDKVVHRGKIWVSQYDNNCWEPGVFGWEETA